VSRHPFRSGEVSPAQLALRERGEVGDVV